MADKRTRNHPGHTTWGDKLNIRRRLIALGANPTPQVQPHPTKTETYVVSFKK